MATREQALIATYGSFVVDVERVGSVFKQAMNGYVDLQHGTPLLNRSAAWYCLIELHDAWARFCRQVVLLSASGDIETRMGRFVSRSTTLAKNDDPESVLRQRLKRSKWNRNQFPWHIRQATIDAANLLTVGNYSWIAAGISAVSPAPEELCACRNFLAHRGKRTATHSDIQQLRSRIGAHTRNITVSSLPAIYVPGGVTLFEEWCIELQSLAFAAIE
jgi:hypothetical protein